MIKKLQARHCMQHGVLLDAVDSRPNAEPSTDKTAASILAKPMRKAQLLISLVINRCMNVYVRTYSYMFMYIHT